MVECLDYLEWLRWPDGFVCPQSRSRGGWRLSDRRWECLACGRRQFAVRKDRISATTLHRTLEIGSYQTAWAMLHRLRSVLVRPGRERLTGEVGVDESYFGSEEPGLRGGRTGGKKTLVGIAIERTQPRGFGRCRMAILTDASAESLRKLQVENWRRGPP